MTRAQYADRLHTRLNDTFNLTWQLQK